MPSFNRYLAENLFGFTTCIQDTSYVVFNLYMRKLGRCTKQQLDNSGVLDAAVDRDRVHSAATHDLEHTVVSVASEGSCSSSGRGGGADTIEHVLCPFVDAILEYELLPLVDACGLAPDAAVQRASRERFLRTVYANPLPPAASSLLDALKRVDDVCRTILKRVADPLGFKEQPTTRILQVELQSDTRRLLTELKSARGALEDALNVLNGGDVSDDDDADHDHCDASTANTKDGCTKRTKQEQTKQEQLYQRCTRLYNECLVPRITACELICAARSALAVRSQDAVEFACRAMEALALLPRLSGHRNGARSLPPMPPSLSQFDLRRDILGYSRECGAHPADVLYRALRPKAAARCYTTPAVPLHQLLPEDALRVLHVVATEVPIRVLEQLCALSLFRQFYSLAEAVAQPVCPPDAARASETFAEAADDLCDTMLACGISDAELWLAPRVTSCLAAIEQRRSAATTQRSQQGASISRTGSFANARTPDGAPAVDADGDVGGLPGNGRAGQHDSNSLRSFGSSSNMLRGTLSSSLGAAALSGRHLSRTTSNVPVAEGDKSIQGLLRELDCVCDAVVTASSAYDGTSAVVDENPTSVLYDLIGRVNLFLRRTGLAHEVKASGGGSAAGGSTKVVSTMVLASSVGPSSSGGTGDAFLPHNVDDALGFDGTASELYSRACLLHRELADQQRTAQQLEALIAMSDDAFFVAAHDDLLSALLRAADDHCVITPSREAVAKRLARLMVVRIKLFHHSGAVRALTVPQTDGLDCVLAHFNTFWPGIADTCAFSYMDEDDRIVLTTDREYRDLLRHRRSQILEGIDSSAMQSGLSVSQSTMGRSTTNAPSNALKIELFADPIGGSHRRDIAPLPHGKQDSSRQWPRISGDGHAQPQHVHHSPSPQVKPSAQHGDDRNAVGVIRVPPCVPQRATNVFQSLPPDVSINDYIREMERAHRGSGASLDDIQRMYERRAMAMGMERTADVAQAPSAPPGGQPVTKGAPPPPPPPPPGGAAPDSARQMFLAMGQAKRRAEDGVGSGGVKTWGAPPSVGARQGPAPTAGPSSAYGQLSLAQHSFKGEDSFLRCSGTRDLEDDDDDGDDLGVDPLRPSWNRGSDRHVAAVMHSGSGVRAPPRITGPSRRSGVPLPREAKPSTPRHR